MRLLAPALLVALLLTGCTALASDPVAPPPSAQRWDPDQTVWTVFTEVDALVRDNYATVKVIADIRNQGPDPEFPFVVRVPDDAFVTGLVIERDGQVFEAQIKGREEAREEYDAWKAREQTGGLVEKSRRTNVFSYLINVAEFTNVRATLTYERYLVAEQGVYNLSLEAPVSGFGRDLGARFTVRVVDTDGVAALWGDPGGALAGDTLVHEVGPRPGVEHPTPFTASYMLDATPGAGSLRTSVIDGKGYFAHRFRAPQDAADLPMDLVLVLDVSGSMSGTKLQQMVDAAKQVVQTLRPEDTLHLVAFSSQSTSAWDGLLEMTPENRRRAAREIDALFDGGGTNIEAGLRRGFSALDDARTEGRFPAVVLLTDGQPTAGVTDRAQLRELASNLNAAGVPLFGIAFGDDADFALVRSLARDAEGSAVKVPLGAGAEVDLRRFMAALTTPVLRDVRIAYGPGVVATEPMAPILFGGSELLVVGTYDPSLGIRGEVTGTSPEGRRTYAFEGGEPATLPFLPRLLAYHEVRLLEEQVEAEGQDPSAVARIVALALEHGFVTDHTSLVVTLPQRDVRMFDATETGGGLDRDAVRTSATPASAPAADSGGWWPFGGTRGVSQEAMQDSSAGGPPRSTGEPAPAVPGPGLALVVLALAGLALLVRRR